MGESGSDPMTKISNIVRDWAQDKLLGSVIRNTGYLVSSNTIGMVLTSIQGILAAILLGPVEYGKLGMMIMFASSVNRLLSFRMGDLVIKYAGDFLARNEVNKASAVIKLAGLTEIITSVFAYILLVLLSPFAAKLIIKDPLVSKWIILYGIALLANLATETSIAVLQLGNQFKKIAMLNLAQSILTAGWIVVLFVSKGNVFQVLMAYLAGKLVFGLGIFIISINSSPDLLGSKWWQHSLSEVKNKKAMAKFAVSTNLSGTVNLIIRDSEVLWVGYFLSSLEAGYYKFGLAIMNIILMPITPFIQTTFPEINKAIAQRNWGPLKRMIQRTTVIAITWTLACALGLAVLGKWLLSFIKDGAYIPSLPVVFILLIGYGFANIFFWNRNLLLSLGNPNFPLFVTAIIGTLKTIAMFILVPVFGYLVQAGLLSAYFVLSVGITVVKGYSDLKKKMRTAA